MTDPIRDALSHIPPDDRDIWVRMGMAVKSELGDGGFDVWDAWSQASEAYNNRDAKDVWHSIRADGQVGIGTLYHEAAAHGWRKVNGSHAGPTPERKPAPEAEDAAKLAARLWDAAICDRAADHAYLCDKGVGAHGIRLGVWQKGDRQYHGAVLVPLRDVDGNLLSLQAIFARDPGLGRSKDFLAGARKSGLMHIIGEIDGANTICIGEGYATAASVYEATKHPTVMAIDAGNLLPVAKALRAKYPGVRLVICGDDDHQTKGNPGITKATEAAKVVGGLLAVPDFGKDRPEGATDFNDLARHAGAEAVKRAVAGAKAPETPQRYKLLTSDDLRAMPAPEWRIKGVLPVEGLAAIFGPSTAGKSFLALDMAAAISTGAPTWFSYRVEPAPVVYIVLEGEAGFRMRVRAWETVERRALPMLTVMQSFHLNEGRDIYDLSRAIVQAVGRGIVIFVDTYNRASPGLDENGSRDTGLILEACRTLQRETAGLVVLIAHSGKDASKGLRGHSSLFAALDGAVEVQRTDESREWAVAKSKDGEDGKAHPFRLDVVELDEDRHGDPITSCVVRPDETREEVKRIKLPQGGNQRLVYDALGPLFRNGVTGKPGAPPYRPCIELSEAIEAAASSLPHEERKRRTEAARTAITGLIARGIMGLLEDWLWLK